MIYRDAILSERMTEDDYDTQRYKAKLNIKEFQQKLTTLKYLF